MRSLVETYLRKLVILGLDLGLVLITLPLSLLIRLDFDLSTPFLDHLVPSYYAAALLCYLFSFMLFRSYKTIIRLVSLFTALRFCVAVAVGGIMFYVMTAYIVELKAIPRSVYIIQMLVLAPISLAIKFSARILERVSRRTFGGTRTLIYGGGIVTDRFLPMLLRSPEQYKIIGIIDDNRAKRGCEVQGIRILGTSDELKKIVLRHKVEQVILSVANLPGSRVREIADLLYTMDVKVKKLPTPEEFFSVVNSHESVVQDLRIEDLLQRATRTCASTQIKEYIAGRTILVTGGGGSIGSELVRQIASMSPKLLIINDASEYALYQISEEMRDSSAISIKSKVGDLADPLICREIFEEYDIDIVFHACAYKHVPLAEDNVLSVVRNNVLSAQNVFEAAAATNVSRVLLISSDKAVRPTNVMGATKRLCELLLLRQAEINKGCIYSCVRFGNVLGSSGSVIPKFIEQIKAGGPITITHPEMTRFFMLIPEAVALVLQTLAHRSSGETFILNMGQPIRIQDLARDLLRCFGRQVGKDIKMVYSGLRPGEKLHEELHLDHERLAKVDDDLQKVLNRLSLGPEFDARFAGLMGWLVPGQGKMLRHQLFRLLESYDGEMPSPQSAKSDFPMPSKIIAHLPNPAIVAVNAPK